MTLEEEYDKYYPTSSKEHRDMILEAFKNKEAGFDKNDNLWYTNDIIKRGIEINKKVYDTSR